MTTASTLRVLALVTTLSPSPNSSSSQLLAEQTLAEFEKLGCTTDLVRVVDHPVRFGVEKDMGDGDAWPTIRAQVMDADILLISTPIWMGQPSSVCKVVLERLDAEISETDEQGRMSTYGKVAAVAVVGNEDGAHHVSAELYQSLNDVGFSLAPNAITYWNGPAMGSTDYQDLDEVPEATAGTTRTLAVNAVHLARLLKYAQYPGSS
jgi:multimeric flavodoxin WrbA